MRTHLNRIGQLGNTGLRPFTLRSIGRQLRDAPSDGHRSSFAFPGLRRFHRLSCLQDQTDVGISDSTNYPFTIRAQLCYCRVGQPNGLRIIRDLSRSTKQQLSLSS
jgi:hypothetical protein